MHIRPINMKLHVILLVSAFALVLGVGLTGCATAEQELDTQNKFDAHRKIGMGFMIAHNYPAAIGELIIAEKLKPDAPEIHNDLALVYFFRDHPVDAERELRKALRLRPTFTDARNNLGRLYIELAQYPDAIRELTQCEHDLTYAAPEKVQYNLALVKYKTGEYAESKEHAQRALSRAPKMCESLLLVGESDFQMSRYVNAQTELVRAKAQCDASLTPEIDYYLGLSYFQGGDPLKAKNILEELVRGNHGSAYSKRAQSALRIIR
jgi:type IV pilus assembly protein PilF